MKAADSQVAWFLQGGGIAGEVARAVDWAATPLGATSEWPESLRTTVATVLNSRHPMFLWWGPELIQFYNDGYLPSFGEGRHPAAMGQRGRECWPEIWHTIGPQIEDVMLRAKPSWNEDQLVPIIRNGRLEEVYWTYGYSPVFRENGEVGGTLVVVTETTQRVLALRRLRSMPSFAGSIANAADARAVMRNSAKLLDSAADDVPFALFYGFDRALGHARLEASVGVGDDSAKALHDVFGSWAGEQAEGPLRLPEAVLRELATDLNDSPRVPATHAFAVPLRAPHAAGLQGFVLFGLNARLPFDDSYRDYLLQMVEHLVLAQARIEAFDVLISSERERNNLLLQAPVGTALLMGPEHVYTLRIGATAGWWGGPI